MLNAHARRASLVWKKKIALKLLHLQVCAVNHGDVTIAYETDVEPLGVPAVGKALTPFLIG